MDPLAPPRGEVYFVVELPTLLVHGSTIWMAILAAFVLVVLVSVAVVRYGLARRKARRAGDPIRRDHAALRGILRGGSGPLATTLSVEVFNLSSAQPTAGAVSWRAKQIWLETADRKIELVGALHVVVGRKYRSKRRRMPALSPEGEAAVREGLPFPAINVHTSVEASVSAGDEVVVCGVPVPQAGQGEATSREADIAWSLQGETGNPLDVVATTPGAPRLSLGLVRTAIVIAAALAAGSFVKSALGERWARACVELAAAKNLDPHSPVELGNDHVCVLAASVPGERDRAIYFLHRVLEDHAYRDAAAVARLDLLEQETLGCTERVSKRFFSARYEAAIEESRKCGGDRRFEHEALVNLGRFEEAAAVPVPGYSYTAALPGLDTLVALGRWEEAAATLDVSIAANEHDYPQTQNRCLAELFRHHGGDAGAADRLRALAAEPHGAQCTALLAEIDPAVKASWLTQDYDGTSISAGVLRELSGDSRWSAYGTPEHVLISPDRVVMTSEAAQIWLPRIGTTTRSRIQHLRWQAVGHVLDNDLAAANRAADEAIALAGGLTERERDLEAELGVPYLRYLKPAIALYGDRPIDFAIPPDPGELWISLYERLIIRSKDPLTSIRLELTDDRMPRAFAAVKATGDGKALLDALHASLLRWEPLDVLAILPHVRTGRDALARHLPSTPRGHFGDSLFAKAFKAFAWREVAEALGNTEEAARWDAVYRRFDRVFEDRAKLIGLMFL